ncbi:ParB/RepB/Spo0J family partition protein [Roseinatronobacter alkalisoli]|uniref:ParB/RepB/Spo0J family partition protein n=1 Tax=Roseinatronobacter alkalisoli TaxID=3028235 RepID=A0ABT5TA57_9RHOB|nr:ParB/RepB/Spo0J family partition protein [Roseinatronobacter sp. HJB301]MDD7971871.1 ParB/RepB/Spo0J family partition protein [Roseinatronobacter sp. HJB301]
MTERKLERRGLGRGLSALMADVTATTQTDSAVGEHQGREQRLPVEKLVPNPDQPRRHFDDTSLAELAASIKEKGVIQPLIVRMKGDMYEIIAGERRWRAAQRAQVHEVPVIIRDFTDTEVLEIAIIENIQRADLNPVEEAMGYRQLIERFGHTQEKLAEAMGKSRSHIANLMRLLTLPEDVLAMLREGRLSAGHARALITADLPSTLARKVVAEGLSVRQTEALVKKPDVESRKKTASRSNQKDADLIALQNDLSAALKLPVDITYDGGGKGQVVIKYRSMEEMDRLCKVLGNPIV